MIDVIILGIIEGITEFLPISSTGHLLLAELVLHERQSDAFIVLIQGGAVAAVLLVFHQRVRQLFAALHDPAARDYLAKLVAAFAITAVGGLALKAAHFELPQTATPVGIATLVGGVAFVAVERWLRGRPASDVVTWTMAVVMGLAQLLAAVFPGTSRSGAAILFTLAMGLSRPMAVEFSFLLGVPTLLAAGAVQAMSYAPEPGVVPLRADTLLVGAVVSAVTAFLAVAWLLRYLRSHTFEGFGWYRIALGAAVLLTLLLR